LEKIHEVSKERSTEVRQVTIYSRAFRLGEKMLAAKRKRSLGLMKKEEKIAKTLQEDANRRGNRLWIQPGTSWLLDLNKESKKRGF